MINLYLHSYTNDKGSLMSNFNVPIADVPELNIPGEEVEILTHAYFNVSIKIIAYHDRFILIIQH